MSPILPSSGYRPPPLVAEYVARRLIRNELLAIPHLETPSSQDPIGGLTNLFSRVGISPRQAAVVRQRIQRPKGIEGSVVNLRSHCGTLEELFDEETIKLAKEAIVPIPALADDIFAKPEEFPFTPFGREDALVLAAARWFKHTYFRWVDPIKCSSCGGETQNVGGGMPTAEEREGGAGRVEIYKCKTCGSDRRFPRYNNAKALMKSKEGRCGEFAQLFYVFLLALGIEARYVWNSEDHVWTEYWSPSLGHWTHVDSCEAESNKPLLYDRGWGKVQRWCLAYGALGGEDVTRAYVDDWDACLARRMQATEEGSGIAEERLRVLLLTATVQRRAGLSPTERERIAEMDKKQARWMDDEPKRHVEAEKAGLKGKGRESGTKEWIEERGEGGDEKEDK